jgi:hypothetical protein
MLRTILGPKRDEVTGGWGKLHDEELLNLNLSSSYSLIGFYSSVMDLHLLLFFGSLIYFDIW